MMYKLLVIFMCFSAFAVECDKHPIYCHIKSLKLPLSHKKVMGMSNLIYNLSKRYKVDSRLVVAIIRTESRFRNKAANCVKGLNSENKEVEVCRDFGIMQISYKTIRGYGFDLDLIRSDLEYSMESGVIVLRDFKRRYAKKYKNWYVSYNVGTRPWLFNSVFARDYEGKLKKYGLHRSY